MVAQLPAFRNPLELHINTCASRWSLTSSEPENVVSPIPVTLEWTLLPSRRPQEAEVDTREHLGGRRTLTKSLVSGWIACGWCGAWTWCGQVPVLRASAYGNMACS